MHMQPEKVCSKCGVEKPSDDFNKNGSQPCGLQSRCRVCEQRENAEWRGNNREKIAADQKRRGDADPEGRALICIRHRAKKLGVPFDLKRGDLVWPNECPILGIPLTYHSGKKARDDAPSVDRIVPSLGYVVGNVQVISARANRIKNDATVEELQKIARYMGVMWA